MNKNFSFSNFYGASCLINSILLREKGRGVGAFGEPVPLLHSVPKLVISEGCLPRRGQIQAQSCGRPENSGHSCTNIGPTLAPPYGKQTLFAQLPPNLVNAVPSEGCRFPFKTSMWKP